MEVNFSIEYHHAVVREDIPKLSSATQRRVKRAIEEKLTTHPELFGKPLRRSIRGYRKLRVGNYRVIFRIAGFVVKILIIQHRSVVYQMIHKRL
ncbi:addiction module antitoxin RelB [Candidatus Uhrbacteria bacterium RIFCSPLOWO2_02_FULL_51_9]|uniref:Addiction module antitoxin RelB n=1 Tax=Candidatus Uhrbacteria bacterium RIFCSPLOWO2_02_FULL_51_9 TaxID=1802410 RepID=A0A1F7VH52_9BACT|nr:MAG: addiction module antitoxin RelB [Candidatus Uhrbacteria bacterium RIFCSPLOWO2_02_FULL_51_9]